MQISPAYRWFSQQPQQQPKKHGEKTIKLVTTGTNLQKNRRVEKGGRQLGSAEPGRGNDKVLFKKAEQSEIDEEQPPALPNMPVVHRTRPSWRAT